jgi:hypothetical protein
MLPFQELLQRKLKNFLTNDDENGFDVTSYVVYKENLQNV